MTMHNKQVALSVVKRLHEAGFQGLWAGGCVRDMLMGVEAQDYDVATDATPVQVSSLFRRTLQVGAQFGVVVVLLDKSQIEVATFRTDGGYADGRRPETVQFTNAREDAIRRDFTINGMFYDPITNEILDFVGGQADLEAGIIRAIGNPSARFGEDHLRMLRAVRFAARLNYSIEPETWQAICELADRIKRISVERVATELEKIIIHANRYAGLKMSLDCGLLTAIFPSCPADTLRQGIEQIKLLPGIVDLALGLTTLVSAGQSVKMPEVARSLKLSNDVRKKSLWLAEGRVKLLTDLPLSKGRLKQWLANEWFGDLLKLCYADLRYQGKDTAALDELQGQITALGDEEITPTPLLDGNDIMALGIKPGPKLGELFNQMYLAQLEGELTTTEQARQWITSRL